MESSFHASRHSKYFCNLLVLQNCIILTKYDSARWFSLNSVTGLIHVIRLRVKSFHRCQYLITFVTRILLQVAENVARQYNMTKSEFLDPNADDLAVRMALGETHIIAETKRALADEGVNVEVLDEVASGKEVKVNRSSTVLLVKNLPFLTTEAELVSMFGVFGSIARVILPPTKTLALVNYALVESFCPF